MTEHIRWRKSSRSGASEGGCVELANTKDAVRDSKNPRGPALNVDPTRMLAAINAGRFLR